jgi:hypothetical protein
MPRTRDHRVLEKILLQTNQGEIAIDLNSKGRPANWRPRRAAAGLDQANAKAAAPPPPPSKIPAKICLTDAFPTNPEELAVAAGVFDLITFDKFAPLELPLDPPLPDIDGPALDLAWGKDEFTWERRDDPFRDPARPDDQF